MSRFRRLFAAAAATLVVAAVLHAPDAGGSPPDPTWPPASPFSASSFTDVYPAGNAGDGNANTYWESANNAFPQWLQVDLGSAVSVNQTILKLPPAAAWQTRTQTLTVQGSTNGSSFSTLKASAGYTFNPSSGNTVTIDFTAATARYVRLNITGNTGWPAGQLSELEVYGPAAATPRRPTAPGKPGLHPAGQRADPAHLERVHRQRRRHRLRHLRQRPAADQRRGNVLPTPTCSRTAPPSPTTSGPRTRPATLRQQQHGHPYRAGRRHPGADRAGHPVVHPAGHRADPARLGRLLGQRRRDRLRRLRQRLAEDHVAGNVLTYTDNQPATATVSYYVRAKDAAGNESAPSNTVTRTGTSSRPGPTWRWASRSRPPSTVFTFVATNANDNNVATYWEGNGTRPR